MKIVKKILALNFFFLFAFAVIIPSVSAEARYGRVLIVGEEKYEPLIKQLMTNFVEKKCLTEEEKRGYVDFTMVDNMSLPIRLDISGEDIGDEGEVVYNCRDTFGEFEIKLVVVGKTINSKNYAEIDEEYREADVIFYFYDDIDSANDNFKELRSARENNTFKDWFERLMKLKNRNFPGIENFTDYIRGQMGTGLYTVPEEYRKHFLGLGPDGTIPYIPEIVFDDPRKFIDNERLFYWYCDNCPNKFFVFGLCVSKEGLVAPDHYANKTVELMRNLPNVQPLFYEHNVKHVRFCVIETLGRFCGIVNRLGYGPLKNFLKAAACLFKKNSLCLSLIAIGTIGISAMLKKTLTSRNKKENEKKNKETDEESGTETIEEECCRK